MTFWDGSRWVPDAPTAAHPRRTRRLVGAAAEALLITALIFGLIAGTTLAARGGGKVRTSGTLTPSVLDGADNVPNYGERLTFLVETTATDRPFVGLKCWQGTTGVYNSSIGIFPTYLFDPWFNLDSAYWVSGLEARCTATLYYYDRRGNQRVLNTTEVVVAP
jgi:hypothetical protein